MKNHMYETYETLAKYKSFPCRLSLAIAILKDLSYFIPKKGTINNYDNETNVTILFGLMNAIENGLISVGYIKPNLTKERKDYEINVNTGHHITVNGDLSSFNKNIL